MATKTLPFGFRFDKALLERIERLQPRLEKRSLGATLSRSAVVRAALNAGLDVLEHQLAQEER